MSFNQLSRSMELEITRIQSPYFEKGRAEPPDTIIIHSISLPPGEFGKGYVIDFFTGRLDSSLHPYFMKISNLKVSSHFFIQRDGAIYQFVDTEDIAWHAGESFFSGRKDCNRFSIGIELEGDLIHEFTDAQYKSLLFLCRDIIRRYPAITLDRIVGHSDVAPQRKEDPGPLFNWKDFKKRLSLLLQERPKRVIPPKRGKWTNPFLIKRDEIWGLIERMKIEEKVAQLIVSGIEGTEPRGYIAELIKKMGLGGIILFGKNCPDPIKVYSLCKGLQEIALSSRHSIPLMICIDQEGGRIVRIKKGVTLFPGHEDLGIIGSLRSVEAVARITALELRALGIQMNLAPVADINEFQSSNHIIAKRSFGSDPKLVSSMVRAWCRGSQSVGVAACAKHFPGHGAVFADSHHEIPECKKEIEEIEKVHLLPFVSAAKVPCAAIMVGHLKFHALDPHLPSSLSKNVVEEILRKRIGFGGVCISDDMEMKAISDNFDLVEASIMAWQAGIDLILIGRNLSGDTDMEKLIDGIVSSIKGDREMEARIDISLRRFLGLKANYHVIMAKGENELMGLLKRRKWVRYAQELERRINEGKGD